MSPRPQKSSPEYAESAFKPYLLPSQAPIVSQTDLFQGTVMIDKDGIHATEFVRSRVDGILQDQLTRISPDLKMDAPIPRWAAQWLRRSILKELNKMNIRVDLLRDKLSLGHGPNDDEHFSLGKEDRPYRKVVKN